MNIHIYGLFQDGAAFVRFVGTADGRDDGDAARAIEDAVRDELYPPSVAAWMNFIKPGTWRTVFLETYVGSPALSVEDNQAAAMRVADKWAGWFAEGGAGVLSKDRPFIEPEDLDLPKDWPRAKAKAKWTGTYWDLTLERCPFCGETHHHGGGGDLARTFGGSRVPHCVPAEMSRTYVLVVTEITF